MKEIRILTDNDDHNKITPNTSSSSPSQKLTKSIPQLVEYLMNSLENFNQELMLKETILLSLKNDYITLTNHQLQNILSLWTTQPYL
jgi:hypothetical protein